MALEKILVVDDELLIRTFLEETLKRKGHDVDIAENGREGIALIKKNHYDLVITDMKMPHATGLDVLRNVKEESPNTLVIIMTAFGSVESAVEAMRLGAYDYILKPFSPDTIEAALVKAKEHIALVEENKFLREVVSSGSKVVPSTVIAGSSAMLKILDDARRVAASNASVFISGESGTGKEVIASFIHNNSPRNHRPFVKVNCAAIPETLVESEFFGHEKGSFTGATTRRLGRFELANKGTLLLDEITEIPSSLQAKLLRVVQEQEVERVGGSKAISVDVRLVSTSNRIMSDAIEEGIFREDLYYRLNVIPLHLPPLRERRDDIIPLAEYFLHKLCIENHKKKKILSDDAMRLIMEYNWPGNIRELANIIERTIVMDYDTIVTAEHLNINVGISAKERLKELSIRSLSSV